MLAFQVTHPAFPDGPFPLVGGRGHGRAPIYLVTTEAGKTAQDAWKVVRASSGRWRSERALRHLKSDRGLPSLRGSAWQERLKLLGLLTLAEGFVLERRAASLRPARAGLLDLASQRRGRGLPEGEVPLSRVRLALCKRWLAFAWGFVRRGRCLLATRTPPARPVLASFPAGRERAGWRLPAFSPNAEAGTGKARRPALALSLSQGESSSRSRGAFC